MDLDLTVNETKNSRMEQVKLVEDSLRTKYSL